MSKNKGHKIDLSKIKLPVKNDTVPCIVCGTKHERRPGPVHTVGPMCQKCDERINNPPLELRDTVDFTVRGF